MTRQKRTHWIPYQTRPSGSSVPRSTRSFARSDPFARRRRRTPRATTRREIPRRVRTNKNVSIRFARGGRVEPTGMRAREASNAFERPAPPASRGGSGSHRDYPRTPIRRVIIREKRRSNTALEVASPVWIDSTRTTRRATRRDASDVPWPAPARRLPRIHLPRERAWIGGTRASASRRRKRNERQTCSCAELCRPRGTGPRLIDGNRAVLPLNDAVSVKMRFRRLGLIGENIRSISYRRAPPNQRISRARFALVAIAGWFQKRSLISIKMYIICCRVS